MASPLYFLPAVSHAELAPGGRLSAAVLARFGDLIDVLGGEVDLRRDLSLSEVTGHGPGGKSGCLVIPLPPGPPPVRLCYAPDFQTWVKVEGSESAAGPSPLAPSPSSAYFIGTDNEYPPTPADLRRRRTFHGYEVELAGESWTVPVIRDPEGGSGLPRDFVYADGGRIKQRIKAQYFALWEKFARACWLFFDPESPWPLRMELTEATDLCLSALRLNYRVGRAEQNLLGLVDSETWYTILAAAVDYPTFRDVAETVEGQKKTALAAAAEKARLSGSEPTRPAPASIASSPGPVADCRDIAPPAANSGPRELSSEEEGQRSKVQGQRPEPPEPLTLNLEP